MKITHLSLKRTLTFVAGRTRLCSLLPSIRGTIPQGGKGVAVSQYAELERAFTEQDILQYGSVAGDPNRLHSRTSNPEDLPEAEALRTAGLIKLNADETATQPLVHGMLVGSLFTSIFGTLIPGAVYLSQTLRFQAPVFADEPVVGRIEILRVKPTSKGGLIVVCDSKVLRETTVCVAGEATVWLPGGVKS